jgi:hypothetical protein
MFLGALVIKVENRFAACCRELQAGSLRSPEAELWCD